MTGMMFRMFESIMGRRTWVFGLNDTGEITLRKGILCSEITCQRYADGMLIGAWDDEDIPAIDVSPVCITHDDSAGDERVTFIMFPDGDDTYMEWFR